MKNVHITEALMHWLPIQVHIKFKLCVLVYKSLNGTAPMYIADKLQLVTQLQRHTTLRSATNCDLVVPPCRLHFGECVFTVAAWSLWNNLPGDVRHATSLAVFKKNFKTFLFCKHC